MAYCPLTAGYDDADGCPSFAGGIKAIYFCEAYYKATFTQVAGVVTVMTLTASKAFRRYIPKKLTAFFSDSFTKAETGAISYKPTITMALRSLATTLRQEVQLLALNPLMIVVLDNNGKYRLFGYNNIMDLTTGDVQGGKVILDGQNQSLVFVGEELIPAYEITDAAVLAAIGVVAPPY